MLLFNRIKNLSTLSDTEQKISHYILEHANSVTTMSIQELAEKTYTSPATITRYCRKMDTEGFS
ncbi:MAG: winged helix-turn-helix transcriptional regulator, partial [Erysipelothrix sp.]